MKKFMSLVLALVMVMAMMVPAMAATISNATKHDYVAYQIFTGTQAESEGMLGDIAWGDGVDNTALLEALQASDDFKVGDANVFANCETAADVAVALSENTGLASAFANIVEKYTKGNGTSIAAGDTEKDLAQGYYLVVDATALGEYDAKNAALLQLTDTITIQQKYDVPEVEKKVDDHDYNIGDTVTFTLTATMPSTFEGYETYKVIFHDTMSEGLTFDAITSVVVNGKTLAYVEADEETDTEENKEYAYSVDGSTLTVTINDVLALGAKPSSKVVVVYTATLNDKAVAGSAGNKNEVYLEYSNDPNWEADGEDDEEPTGDTPKDEVLVFTYELDVTKVDGKDQEALKDAEFVLYRKNATSANEYVIVDENNKVTRWTTDKAAASTLKSDANGKFVVIGLDEGTYYLEETKAPAGYNLLTAPITLVITATTTEDTGIGSVSELTGLEIKVTVNDQTTTKDGDLSTGIVETTVENNQGTVLPETGGMGTTMMYIGGGLLVAFAVIMLATKRRMNAAE